MAFDPRGLAAAPDSRDSAAAALPRRAFAGLAAGSLLATPALLRAQTSSLASLSLIVFPGGFNLPIWVAEAQGYFRDAGLAVTITPTPNSTFQLTGLIDGRFDVGMTAIDNVIAYQEGQGEAPTTATPDLRAFMGGDNGFLSLITLPEIRSFADLRGKTLAVDALTTGYAFVLLEMLRREGLYPDGVQFARFGGVANRWTTLQRREHAGTLLITPFEISAMEAGFNRLARAPEVIGPYQGLVAAARRGWLAEHPDRASGFVVALRRALAWLYTPDNRAAAVALLRANVTALTEAMAMRSVDVLLDPTYGFAREAAIDVPGVATVLALRSRFRPGATPLTDPARYLDLAAYEAASRRLAGG